jgi:glycosyltransferase involved in cell wall biosynthesis
VGRLSAEKRVDLLLEAVAELRATGCPARLTVLGAGAERDALGALTARLGLTGAVHFAGTRPEVWTHHARADALVCGSDTEGTPRCVLEAMTAGTPVVATAVGGVPQLLGDGAGILVRPGSATALADGLRALFAMAPAAREAMTREAADRARTTYSLGAMTGAVRALHHSSRQAKGHARA